MTKAGKRLDSSSVTHSPAGVKRAGVLLVQAWTREEGEDGRRLRRVALRRWDMTAVSICGGPSVLDRGVQKGSLLHKEKAIPPHQGGDKVPSTGMTRRDLSAISAGQHDASGRRRG